MLGMSLIVALLINFISVGPGMYIDECGHVCHFEHKPCESNPGDSNDDSNDMLEENSNDVQTDIFSCGGGKRKKHAPSMSKVTLPIQYYPDVILGRRQHIRTRSRALQRKCLSFQNWLFRRHLFTESEPTRKKLRRIHPRLLSKLCRGVAGSIISNRSFLLIFISLLNLSPLVQVFLVVVFSTQIYSLRSTRAFISNDIL